MLELQRMIYILSIVLSDSGSLKQVDVEFWLRFKHYIDLEIEQKEVTFH